MTARFWTNVGRSIGLALITAVLVPAIASAASFQRVGPAPGGDDLAVIKGVPHVAYATSGGVRVAELTNGNVWVQVGGAIRHASGAAVSSPSLTSDANGVPWIAWLEKDSVGADQARVAKFQNGSWQEVVGGARPINNSYDPGYGPLGAIDPQIAIFGGRPYVVYIQDAPVEYLLEAVRLNDAGTAWQHVAPHSNGRPATPRIAVSGGRLYLAVEDALVPGFYMYRLNSAGTGWEGLGNGTDIYQQVGDIADVGGAPVIGYSAERQENPSGTELRAQVLGSNDQWTQLGVAASSSGDYSSVDPQGVAGDGGIAYVSALFGSSGSRQLVVSRYTGGAWEPIDNPSDSGADATSANLAPGSTGGVWLLFGQSSGGTTTYYLDTLGASLPAGEGGGNNGGNDNGNPSGPPEPTPRATGFCTKTINGTSGPDRLRGTHLGDSLFGFGGNDTLIAYAGSDCLYGGGGNDFENGGKGNDFFSGGSGNDRLYGRDGDDDLNGNAGNDVIFGGRGEDQVAAGSGNDRVDVSQQGADLVDCGSGRDTVVITPIDGYRNCEKVIIKR